MWINQHFSYYKPKFLYILLKQRKINWSYKCVYQESAKPQRLLPEKTVFFFFFLTWWYGVGHNKACFLTPEVTFRWYPRLYLQIAQAHLDCVVTLSQALVPTVPALWLTAAPWGVGGSSITSGIQSSLVQTSTRIRRRCACSHCLLLEAIRSLQEMTVRKGWRQQQRKNKSQPSISEDIEYKGIFTSPALCFRHSIW